jgi:hypothetical protein
MPAAGDLLGGRYRIIGALGAGGMATVHRAHDERLGRDVAVKVLLPNHASDPVLAARFEREAHELAAAGHPGVVAVYDVDAGGPGQGEPYFVMELCSGGSLAGVLGGEHPIRPDDLVPMLLSVADGLASLHARGIVHRDVKPSNILLTPSRAKLADFGLARSAAGAEVSDLTAAGTAVGTLPYLAPEVLGGAPAASASDVYALGVAAFVGLTGSLPRPAGSLAELVAAASAPAPRASAIAPWLGGAFDEVLASTLDGDPGRRPDAVAFGAGLTSALGAWTRTAATRPTAPESRSPAPAATAALAPKQPSVASAPPAPIVADGDASTIAGGLPTPERPAGEATSTGPLATAPPAAPTTGAGRGGIGGWTVAALVAIVALWAVALGAAALRPTAAPGPTASAATTPRSSTAGGTLPSPSNSPAPTPEPTPEPTAPPTAPPTPTVIDRALAALTDVDAAIAGARGGGGLKGKDANDLERRAAAVRSALRDGDLGRAAKAAQELEDRADALGREIDAVPERRLDDAIERLRATLEEG